MKINIYENYEDYDDYVETYEKINHDRPKFN